MGLEVTCLFGTSPETKSYHDDKVVSYATVFSFYTTGKAVLSNFSNLATVVVLGRVSSKTPKQIYISVVSCG